LGGIGMDVKVILKWILNKFGVGMWTGFMWLRIDRVLRCNIQNSKPSNNQPKCIEVVSK
jgi:hypothetical protein